MTETPDRPLRVFLCHASGDKPSVRSIYKHLKSIGVDAWLDEEKLLPGQKWQVEILKAVRNADAVIVCLSNNSITKEGYVQKEIKFALDLAQEKLTQSIYIIPARLDMCLVPQELSELQWVDLFFDGKNFNKQGFQKIIGSLKERAISIGINWNPKSKIRKAKVEKEEVLSDKSHESPSKNQNISLGSPKDRPALVIYVVDVSGSMGKSLGGKTRLEIVRSTLDSAIKTMADLSTSRKTVFPIFKVALFAYSDQVQDIFGGAKSINDLTNSNLSMLHLMNKTDTASAFATVEKYLHHEILSVQDNSIPIICHITDGSFTGDTPVPIAKRILDIPVKNGNVLIGNIFFCDDMLVTPIKSPKKWSGVVSKSDLRDEYAKILFDMSSIIPEKYEQNVIKQGYKLRHGAKLLFPGEHASEFVNLLSLLAV